MLSIPDKLHTASKRLGPAATLLPDRWVAIDSWPNDNCLYHAVVIAKSAHRFLRTPNAGAVRRGVDKLRTAVSRFVCKRADVFGPLLFPSLKLSKTSLPPPFLTNNTTAPTNEASSAAMRSGLVTYCRAVKRETCHGGKAQLIALANLLKRNVCVYKKRRTKYVLTDSYGPKSATKLRLLHAGRMAYMALVPCALVPGCTAQPHWTPLRANTTTNSTRWLAVPGKNGRNSSRSNRSNRRNNNNNRNRRNNNNNRMNRYVD